MDSDSSGLEAATVFQGGPGLMLGSSHSSRSIAFMILTRSCFISLCVFAVFPAFYWCFISSSCHCVFPNTVVVCPTPDWFQPCLIFHLILVYLISVLPQCHFIFVLSVKLSGVSSSATVTGFLLSAWLHF